MSGGARLLAVWLTPAIWLGMPALVLDRGLDGLSVGLALTLAPLVALGVGTPAQRPGNERVQRFSEAVLRLVVGIVLWANIALAANVAAWFGVPRWQAVAVVALGGFILTACLGSTRVIAALLLAAFLGLTLSLAQLALEVGAPPLAAWERLASQAAFRFPAGSAWVTSGLELGLARGRAPIVFEEEHRVTAPSGGVLRARSSRASRVTEMEWALSAGQSVVLRPGDQIDRASPLALRFEAGKRVPGAPAAGSTWAAGWSRGWARHAGLYLTVLLGGMVLVGTGVSTRAGRRTTLFVGLGLLAALLWAQGWAIYAALATPDLFLGGITSDRLVDLHLIGHGARWPKEVFVAVFLAAAVASFSASGVALRERLRALAGRGTARVGRDTGLWALMFGAAGLAGLLPMEPWGLMLLALGIGAAGMGPLALWPQSRPREATVAGALGLALFAACAIFGAFQGATPDLGGPQGLADAILSYPALAAAPAGAVALWICRCAAHR